MTEEGDIEVLEVTETIDLGENEELPELPPEPEQIIFTTAENIDLPAITPKPLDIAVYPLHRNILKTPCGKVTEELARSEDFRKHIAFMLCTMYSKERPGVGLASNQVGFPVQAIVLDTQWVVSKQVNPKVLLNPVVLNVSDEKVKSREGCLSVPLDYRAEVERFAKVKIGAMTLQWEPIEFDAEGLEGCALQHEIDHLRGTLFIDRLSRLKRDMYERKILKFARRGYKQHKRMSKSVEQVLLSQERISRAKARKHGNQEAVQATDENA